MPHTSEIEKALDDLIMEEVGMKFQALALVLAKQKGLRPIACERKKDLGLDAYAGGELKRERWSCSSVRTDRHLQEFAAARWPPAR